MLWNATKIRGFKVEAADGRSGPVTDLLFDPATWIVRYVELDAGGRKVVPVTEVNKLDAPSSRLLLKPSAELSDVGAVSSHGLRSLEELLRYEIQATDGGIGQAEDFVMRETDWQITFITANAAGWEDDAKVMISRHAVKQVNWDRRTMTLDVDRAAVKASPPYEEQSAVDGDDNDADKTLTYFGISFVNTKHE